MRKLAVLTLASFGITLAVIVGTRMSSEAMAVVIGVACGVLAGVPASLLVAAVTKRRGPGGERLRQQRDYPPVVVIQPGQAGANYLGAPYAQPSIPLPRGARSFHVVGEENSPVAAGWDNPH